MSEWIRTAKVGDKITCIDGKWENIYGIDGGPEPISGEVYTIRSMAPVFSEVYLFLDEMGDGWGFEHRGFRPVEPRKTDISVFTALLNTAPVKVPEAA